MAKTPQRRDIMQVRDQQDRSVNVSANGMGITGRLSDAWHLRPAAWRSVAIAKGRLFASFTPQ